MIRLIASDLDGTLLEPDGKLPEGIFEAIRQLTQMGICFAAASGRQHGNLVRLFSPVANEMAFLCENGAVNIVEGKEAGVIPIPGEVVKEAISCFEELGMNVLLSGRNTSYMVDRNRKFTDDIVYRLKNTSTILTSWNEIHEPILKVSGQIDTGVKQFAPFLLEKWSNRLTATVSGEDWFDLTIANKGSGMQILMDALGVSAGEAMAFGDNFNDETMLDCVGYPFLMEHADIRLRKPGYLSCKKVLPVLAALIQAGGDPGKLK